MKNYVMVALVLLIIAAAFALYFMWRESAKDKVILKNLQENVQKSITYDSLASVKETQILDSINAMKQHLKVNKKAQHDENIILRKNNEAIRRDFNDLDITDRPDF